jgi:hypothetical protein
MNDFLMVLSLILVTVVAKAADELGAIISATKIYIS